MGDCLDKRPAWCEAEDCRFWDSIEEGTGGDENCEGCTQMKNKCKGCEGCEW